MNDYKKLIPFIYDQLLDDYPAEDLPAKLTEEQLNLINEDVLEIEIQEVDFASYAVRQCLKAYIEETFLQPE